MKIEKIELKVLKADAGMVLTNGEAFSDVGGTVYLGKGDSADNWREITEEEYKEVAENEN